MNYSTRYQAEEIAARLNAVFGGNHTVMLVSNGWTVTSDAVSKAIWGGCR